MPMLADQMVRYAWSKILLQSCAAVLLYMGLDVKIEQDGQKLSGSVWMSRI